ncbi:muts domain V-domain-containing protein [Whalleya microplaca]|nr:muts domain V-domain-containing protein [Whalleya microplaca]
MRGPPCRRLTSLLVGRSRCHHVAGLGASRPLSSERRLMCPGSASHAAVSPLSATPVSRIQVRGKKTKSSLRLADLPQGPLALDPAPLPEPEEDEGPAYPTVVLQAHRNMQKFENCVLLTRVGGFYELYFSQAEEYGPLLNLKVAQKKTNAGPVPMAGFPFFQLDRFLKTLVLDFNCYVAIAEEFPNDPGDKVKSGGLMHDRRVTRIITPGTLIDENFIDPYANNYVMAIHVNQCPESEPSSIEPEADTGEPPREPLTNASSIGLAWLDISTGQFYTQSTTVASLASTLSRVGPREIVVNEVLESQRDHQIFSVLAEDKHLITFAPQGEHLPLSEWGPMLESKIPTKIAASFTSDEVEAGSLLLQYVRDRLQGLSMKLQPPMRHENMSVMSIDKNTMRSLEIKETIKDSSFRGSLLHAIRRTVTKGGARLLNAWLSAPSTCLETIQSRQDLVEYFLRHEDLRDEIIQLLRRSHDSQRLVQKFAFGRGDPDDLIALANTIQATQDIVTTLSAHTAAENTSNPQPNSSEPPVSPDSSNQQHVPDAQATCFTSLLERIKLKGPSQLANRIRTSIDEEGLDQQHQHEDSEASELLAIAEDVVASEGLPIDAAALPKGAAAATNKKRKKATSLRDHYADDNVAFVMKPEASPGLRDLHAELSTLQQEKLTLGEELRTQFDAPSLTLRWTPNLGHICHVKGKDARAAAVTEVGAVQASRSTRAFHAPGWTRLGQRIHQARFGISTEETRLFAELRARVVANLVKLRRNAAVLDELDVAAAFARLASEQSLTRPAVRAGPNSAAHVVLGGRHPTVEGGLREQGRSFTKNDCLVGAPAPPTTSPDAQTHGHGRLWLITGPNMAGKSTYLRQNALITILAQAGCYVPADHAELGIVDAIFSRVGSADNLYRDQSTFMVEMLETAQILRGATARSFVIMDEIGRGTTPEDGAAVAFAALHHLVTVNKCRALFATHFHSLADLVIEKGMHVTDGGAVEMYCTDVEEDANGGFVYVHKLRKGVNRQSHALKVARLANLPESVITVAKEILARQGITANIDYQDRGLDNDAHTKQQQQRVGVIG